MATSKYYGPAFGPNLTKAQAVNEGYNLAASNGKVAGPVDPRSGYPQYAPRATNTGGGGSTGGGGQTMQASTGPSEYDLAEARRQAAFNQAKAQAGVLRDSGQRTFNDLISAVNAFRTRNKESYANAGQEIVNRSADMLGTNASTAQDLVGKSTGRARALGLGLSSRIGLGNDLLKNLEGTQGNVIARRGEEDRSNMGLFNQRNDQAQNNENQANTYWKNVQDQAAQLQNTGIENAGYDFASTLGNIANYQRQLSSLQPMNAGSATAYTPNFGGITNTLNSVLGGMSSGGNNTAQNSDVNIQDPNYLRKLIYGQ